MQQSVNSIARVWLPTTIIFFAMLLASYWVFLVPIFQSPDEDYHADYVFSLYSKGRIVRGAQYPIVASSHPWVFYLLKATNGQALKFTDFAKVPANYGTKEFFKRLDQNAADKQTCKNTHTNPVYMSVNPVGYYALAALWLGLVSKVNNHLVFLFFAGRFLSVILLGCGLALSYLIMRELRFSTIQSSLVLAAIGFFPMVTFVGSYMQPDDLTFVVVSACLFLALRWRNAFLCESNYSSLAEPVSNLRQYSQWPKFNTNQRWAVCGLVVALAFFPETKWYWLCCIFMALVALFVALQYSRRLTFSASQKWTTCCLGVALAILHVTKWHFFCCIFTAVIALVVGQTIHLRFSFRRILAILAVLLIPSVIAGMFQLWLSWDCHQPTIDMTHWHWFPVDTAFRQALSLGWHASIVHISKALSNQYHSICFDYGPSFKSFWGSFGWVNIPLIIVSPKINDVLRTIIAFVTMIVVVMTLASLVKVTITLLRLVRRRRFSDAFVIACSNPVINSNFLLVIFFFLFNVIYYPSMPLQGRHWFAFILPIILSAAYFAPRVFPSRRMRQTFFYLIVIGWLSYSVVGSYYAIACVHKRFYEEEKQLPINVKALTPVNTTTDGRIQHCDYMNENTTFNRHANTLMVPRGSYMHTIGWVLDTPAQAAATAALLYIDDKIIIQPIYGLESKEPVEKFHNSNYRFAGFATLIPTSKLSPGWHSLSLKGVSKNGRFLYNSKATLRFIVLAN